MILYSLDLFLSKFFSLFQMPVPTTAGQCQEPAVESCRLIAAGLGHAAQSLGPADGVFDFDAAAGVDRIRSSLGVDQGGVGAFFTASRLAVGQAVGRQVVIGD